MNENKEFKPYIPAEKVTAEMTVTSVLMGVILAIVFRAAIKPTPSIAQTQKTVNRDLDNVEIEIHGRHDPMIVPRAVVVVESMAAVTILDGVLKNLGATMDNIKKIYGE